MPIRAIPCRYRAGSLAAGLVLSMLQASVQAQTYISAPDTGGNVAGWMSNRPVGTREQDWYRGSGVVGIGSALPDSQRRNADFVAAGGNQAVHGGLTFATGSGRSSQDISGLTANDLATARANGQYLEFPLTMAAAPLYADGSASPVKFYLNLVSASVRSDIFQGSSYANNNHFGYGAYLYAADGTEVELETAVNAASFASETNHTIFSAPVGSSDAIELKPGASYALRIYLHKRDAAANGWAGWDDVMLGMSRSTVAELSVQAGPISSTPQGSNNDYSYSFEVYNNGPDAGTAVVTDPMPAAAVAAGATWTCVVSGTSTPCATASGSGPISAVQQPLDSGGRVSYTVTWTGPAPSAPQTDTISIVPGTGSPQDINTANNSAVLTLAPAAAVPVGGVGWLALVSLGMIGLLGRRLVRR